jgi:hypothetical protein
MNHFQNNVVKGMYINFCYISAPVVLWDLYYGDAAFKSMEVYRVTKK